MTLVIAGHQYEKKFHWHSHHEESADKWDQHSAGIFLVADSAITDSQGQTLLNGFRKIYPVRAKVWEPYFVGEYFQGYRHEFHSVEVAVAFAGSTLSAQHYMNSISEHLGNLRITFVQRDGPIQYRICLPCEANPLEGPGVTFDETTFVRSGYDGLFTADVLAKAVLHSLQHALKSARKYKIDDAGFKSLFTEFALAVQCPMKHTYHLYQYPMTTEKEHGIHQPRVSLREVPHDEIVVLGMREEFANLANTARSKALAAGVATDVAMFEFLNSAINSVKHRGHSGIDHPAVMKVLKNGALEEIARKN